MTLQMVEIFISFFLIGLGAYGGGIVAIPLIEQEIVIKHAWLTPAEFTQFISVSEMTPGPIAINVATFVGYQRAGFLGALFSTIGVVTPSILIMAVVIRILTHFGSNYYITRFYRGIRPGVLALIVLAVVSIGKAGIHDGITLFIAVVTFILMCVFKNKLHPAVIIILAGIAGLFIL